MPDSEEQQAGNDQPTLSLNEERLPLTESRLAAEPTVATSSPLAGQSVPGTGLPAPSESFGAFDMPEGTGTVAPYAAPPTPEARYASSTYPPVAGAAPYPPMAGSVPYPAPGYAYAPGQPVPFVPFPPMPVPKLPAPIYFPLTRKAPVHMQIFGMLFYSLLMAISIMGILLYLASSYHPGLTIFVNPSGEINGLAILLVVVLVVLVAPACTLLSGALFGSWRGLLVSLASIGGGFFITHLSNNQFETVPKIEGVLTLLGLPIAALIVGLIYDARKYAAWWKSMFTMMLGASIISIWFFAFVFAMGVNSDTFAAGANSSSNPAAFMAGVWIVGGCFSFIGILGLTFPIAGIEGLIHWRIVVEKEQAIAKKP